MKNFIFIAFFYSISLSAQNCNKGDDLSQLSGSSVDAAHCEWPQQKAHWFDELKTPVNKAAANKTLTQIENLEKESRKNYAIKGGILKMAFGTPSNANTYFGKNGLLSYDLNQGFYEYFCNNNQPKVNSEYAIVFRAYVNRPFYGIETAYTFADDNPYYEQYNQYNGKFIALCNFLKLNEEKIKPNSIKGYYQDIPESTVKSGNRSTFMTRHWYFTKTGIQPLVPVTRKQYLEALLVYYDREAMATAQKIKEIETECAKMMKDPVKFPQLYENGKKNLVVRKARFPDWQKKNEAKKAIVQQALKENSAEWLSQPAVVKPQKEIFYFKNYYGSGSNEYVNVEVDYADSLADAQKTGEFTFSGFWDAKGGTKLYQYNPDYFKGSETNPTKPYQIELTYRYINTILGKSLVENFTENFDFEGVRKLLE
ncbi:hypothetical protein [Chryseobacterium koreense]|uniref:Uncharacterized protein n=1 Tax=Chryseobacterium koreense CCUG 49689 TaxID=1304281 RepID=A0A0J7IZ70_9FLAO|nr:hypothetical protein [Chryseobacterium koreense]KMQ71101.1 hypothetical protein ACM44_09185 [Chryseobacterium koreense CCUG 49689]MBB5332800.1 hypothetical protein [Chryseobacterium koreense]